MDLTISRNGEANTIPVEHTNGALNGTIGVLNGTISIPKSNSYAKLNGKALTRQAGVGSIEKEVQKQKTDKINFDLFEQIAVERSDIAFSEFYDRFAPKVYAFLLRLVRTEEDALDLLQEVFILIWNKAPALYKIHGNPVPWLIQLARNRAMDEIKSRRFQSRRHTESYDVTHHDIVADDQTPEANFVTTEARTEIQNALSSLDPRQRKVIEMMFFGGMTYQDVADSLQMPMGSVGKLMRQAIMELGLVLKPRMGIDLPPTQSQKEKKDKRSTLRWKKIDEAINDLKEEGSNKWKKQKSIQAIGLTPPAKEMPPVEKALVKRTPKKKSEVNSLV